MPTLIDELPPFEDVSLAQFNANATRILGEREYNRRLADRALTEEQKMEIAVEHQYDLCAYMKYVITGQDEVNDTTARIQVLRDALPGSWIDDNVEITRDFDSLIGFSTTLPLRCPLSIYPVVPFKDTLTKAVHVEYNLRIGNVGLSANLSNPS